MTFFYSTQAPQERKTEKQPKLKNFHIQLPPFDYTNVFIIFCQYQMPCPLYGSFLLSCLQKFKTTNLSTNIFCSPVKIKQSVIYRPSKSNQRKFAPSLVLAGNNKKYLLAQASKPQCQFFSLQSSKGLIQEEIKFTIDHLSRPNKLK